MLVATLGISIYLAFEAEEARLPGSTTVLETKSDRQLWYALVAGSTACKEYYCPFSAYTLGLHSFYESRAIPYNIIISRVLYLDNAWVLRVPLTSA